MYIAKEKTHNLKNIKYMLAVGAISGVEHCVFLFSSRQVVESDT